MIEEIRQSGLLINECGLPGESKADDVFPAHPNGIQVSKDRWLLLYATRGYDFDDDDRSIVYQLRRGVPDGPVIKEGLMSQAHDGWEPFGDGRVYFKQHGSPVAFGVPKGAMMGDRAAPDDERAYTKQHGHPVGFGVPKGALIGGKVPAHANLFVVKWRVIGIRREPGQAYPVRDRATQNVEWVQFRLNDREDDIEIIQPVRPLRQRGYEEGDRFCRIPGDPPVGWMNQCFIQASPFNDDCTQWADVNHFEGGYLAPLKYAFDATEGIYHWVQTGPMTGGGDQPMWEAGLVKMDGFWVIAARMEAEHGGAKEGVGWMRTEDPFERMPAPTHVLHPPAYAPLTIFRAADGVLRLFTDLARGGVYRMYDLDPKVSGPRGIRTPLRCWDIDPHDFSTGNERIVFDSYDFGLPIRKESNPTVDMCKLLPHAGGREQYVVHRVRPDSLHVPCTNVLVNAEEKAAAGIYYEKIVYDKDYPGAWAFA